LALDLARKQCRLTLGDRDAQGLTETLRLLQEADFRAAGQVGDITSAADCSVLVQRAEREYGRLDIVILCAGVSMWARFDEVKDLGIFRRLVEVNYLGAVYTVHAALPLLRVSQGLVVAISSLQGEIALPYHTGYAASKHALNGFLEGVEFELGKEIRILRILPGWIRGTGLRGNAFTADGAVRSPARKHSRESVSVEECSGLVIKAIEAGRREVFVPEKLRLLRWLKVISPGLVRRLIRRAVKDQKQ